MCRPALDAAELDLDGPLPHITVLRDELPPAFQDDFAGAEEAMEAVEARGEHTLAEKFGERQSGPLGPPFGLGREEGPLQWPRWCRPRHSATSSVCTGRPGLGLGCPGPRLPASALPGPGVWLPSPASPMGPFAVRGRLCARLEPVARAGPCALEPGGT